MLDKGIRYWQFTWQPYICHNDIYERANPEWSYLLCSFGKSTKELELPSFLMYTSVVLQALSTQGVVLIRCGFWKTPKIRLSIYNRWPSPHTIALQITSLPSTHLFIPTVKVDIYVFIALGFSLDSCMRTCLIIYALFNYKTAICCFWAKHAALRRKSKDGLARNQDNVSEWSDISTCCFSELPLWTSNSACWSIQSGPHHHHIEN
jgi:hypothetical protein